MTKGVYTGVGRLKLTMSGRKIPAGEVVNMPDAALENEYVHALGDICAYEYDDGSICTRTAGWGRDSDEGPCKHHTEDE